MLAAIAPPVGGPHIAILPELEKPMPFARDRLRMQRWTFLILFGFAAYLFWLIVQTLWVPLFLGVLIAVGTHPLHRRVAQRSPRRAALSAALITGLVLAISLALATFMTVVVLGQLVPTVRAAAEQYRHGGSEELLGLHLQAILTSLGQDPEQLRLHFISATDKFAANAAGMAGGLVAASLEGLLVVVFTAITSYYLLRKGERATAWMVDVLPMPDRQVRELVRNFREVTRAMLLGTGATALFQAVGAFLGYWVAGVPSPLVWGSLTGIASIVPGIGTALVWGPVIAWLLATGHVVRGLLLAVWVALVVVGVADYVLRPRLLGSKGRMDDLLVFIAIFGGIQAFGLLGLILGPIVTALLVALVRIYRRDYRPKLEGEPAESKPTA
jgi:predicted PurR-regulated permease PerM